MGLGFNFGGKDAGLTKAIDSALTSVSKFTAGIAGVSTELGDLAKQGRNPTTAFEKEMTANNVSLTNMGANLGKTGKELKDFTSKSQGMALAMNRSAEQAGDAAGQFTRMKSVMVETGIDSEKTLLKISEVSGVQASVFADSSMQLAKMQGMTEKAGADILDTMTAAGAAMGDVAGSLGDAANRTALLQKRSALLAQGFKGIGIEEFSKQIDATSVSFQKATGASAATARAFGTGLAESIQNSAQAFKELTVGVGTDIPEGLKGLALTTGDIGTAFSNMEDGPEGFMKTMRNLTKNMGGDQEKIGQLMTWIQGQTGKAFGPERSKEIVNMLMLTTDATMEQGEAVKNATGALKKYGDEAWKNGRTAAESMKLSEDLFVTGIRAANHTATKFAADAAVSFGDLGKDIQSLAKGEGGVGDLTRSLIDLNQKGLVGLFPDDLQGDAVAMGGMFKMLGDTLTGILNPLSGIESLLTLFSVAMRHAFKSTKASLPFFDRIGEAFEQVGERAVKWFEGLPDRIMGWIDSASDALSKALSGGKSGKWGGIFSKWMDRVMTTFTKMGPIIAKLKVFASDFWEGLTTAMDPSKQSDSDSVGTKVGQWFRAGWDIAVAFGKKVLYEVVDFVNEFWSAFNLDPDAPVYAGVMARPKSEAMGAKLGTWASGVWGGVKAWWTSAGWPAIKQFGTDFWAGLTGAFTPESGANPSSTGGKIGIWMGDVLQTAIEALVDKLPGLLLELTKAIAKSFLVHTVGFISGDADARMTKSWLDGPQQAPTVTPQKEYSGPGAVPPREGMGVAGIADATNWPSWQEVAAETAQKHHEALLASQEATRKANEESSKRLAEAFGLSWDSAGSGVASSTGDSLRGTSPALGTDRRNGRSMPQGPIFPWGPK